MTNISECTFALRVSAHQDREDVISKPVQFQWFRGICSLLIKDKEHGVSHGLYGRRSSLPHTTEELQRAIRDEIATMNQELLCRSAVRFVHR